MVKQIGKWMLDRTVVPAVRYVIDKVEPGILHNASSLCELARIRAITSSVRYAEEKMSEALIFDTRDALWDYALKKICVTGINAEFGVWQGDSINYFARKVPTIYGFDSFEGLKEDWKGQSAPQGSFDLKGKLPKVARNVHLIKGWFAATVPAFLTEHETPFAFVHIDCDTFETVQELLNLIGSRLVPGTVIVFDEYFGFRGWELGEFRAWSEYVQRTGTAYKYLGFSLRQVMLQLCPDSSFRAPAAEEVVRKVPEML
jgi:hypothetical protein